MGRAFLVTLAVLLPLAARADTTCPLPPDFAEAARPLQAVAQGLEGGGLEGGRREGGTLRILVLGSASVTGPGATIPEASWPARLEARLAAVYPGRRLEVAVRGGRGVSVQDHLALLRQEDQAARPHLVIWQLGTVEATRGMDPEEMTEALQDGLERIRLRGGDAMLVEPQFSRFLRANSNMEPYREKLRLAAAGAGAPIFRRWDVMQHWLEHGGPDLERTPREQRAATMDRLNDCLARAMTELIVQGVREAR
ncbi:MAG TPA: SGNH/GDSL hydrolase family protein [Roseococcus sp.]|nr:SGNH/GDSL hydrolase family protein [Roseococcus sp.]